MKSQIEIVFHFSRMFESIDEKCVFKIEHVPKQRIQKESK